jgi:hypothetical protein
LDGLCDGFEKGVTNNFSRYRPEKTEPGQLPGLDKQTSEFLNTSLKFPDKGKHFFFL